MTSPSWKPMLLNLTVAATLSACGSSDSGDPTSAPTPDPNQSPASTSPDTSSPTPDTSTSEAPTYSFNATVEGANSEDSSVSYTGQTARHVLIADLSDRSKNLAEGDASNIDDYTRQLTFYLNESQDVIDSTNIDFTISVEGEEQGLFDSATYGEISTGKNLADKIAGGNGEGGGETGLLLSDFFGWSDDFETGGIPINLVNLFITRIVEQATDGTTPPVASTAGNVQLATYQDEFGRDYQQLLQKFLLGAVTFSQGTADYLSAVGEFEDSLLQREGADEAEPKPYSVGEHEWDEAFGYFGAARDYDDYTDDEIAGKDGRADYRNGFHDSNGDSLIDLRSEYNFGNSTNCAKRDRGSDGATDLTQEAFDAFVAGRELVNQATGAGEFSEEARTQITTQIETAAVAWEKCISATVIHYINDTRRDLLATTDGQFAEEGADVGSFSDLAKHWSEMKGFALGLQFSPYSPFRTESNGVTLEDLQQALTLMGDAPVLADGTQLGENVDGGIDAYIQGLLQAREIFQRAYAFDTTVVENW